MQNNMLETTSVRIQIKDKVLFGNTKRYSKKYTFRVKVNAWADIYRTGGMAWPDGYFNNLLDALPHQIFDQQRRM